MKVLIVFYSRTGTTRKVAEALRAPLDADMEEIRDARPRLGVFRGWLRSIREVRRQSETPIRPTAKHPAEYDLVVLGTPVWASSISSPLRTWLNRHGRELRQTAAFVTQRASGGDKAIAQLASFGLAPIATLIVNAKDVASGTYEGQVDEFVDRIVMRAEEDAWA